MENYKQLKQKLNLIIDEFEKSENSENSNHFNLENINQTENKTIELLNDLETAKAELRKLKLNLTYPKQSNNSEVINNNGLEEERNAILFLSTPQSSRAIIEKLINSLELNKIDFASILFERLVPQIPKTESDWYNLDRTNPEKVQLYKSIQGLYKTFCEKRGIDLIDRELELLSQLENRILDFKQAIKLEVTEK